MTTNTKYVWSKSREQRIRADERRKRCVYPLCSCCKLDDAWYCPNCFEKGEKEAYAKGKADAEISRAEGYKIGMARGIAKGQADLIEKLIDWADKILMIENGDQEFLMAKLKEEQAAIKKASESAGTVESGFKPTVATPQSPPTPAPEKPNKKASESAGAGEHALRAGNQTREGKAVSAAKHEPSPVPEKPHENGKSVAECGCPSCEKYRDKPEKPKTKVKK